MFDGVPDQFHQFIASSAAAAARATTLPNLPLPFPPFNLPSSNGFTPFDPFSTTTPNSHHHHHHLQHQQPQPHHLLHQQHKINEAAEKQEISSSSSSLAASMQMEINDRERSMVDEPIHDNHPWSNDEVLALLRIRSNMETWFPEFTWEHVSRKLAELGFKRSADKCKEKFEEESRYFNTINYSKNFRIFTELEELCQAETTPHPHPHQHQHQPHHHQNQPVVAAAAENNKNIEKYSSREDEDNNNVGQNMEEDQDDSRNLDDHHDEYQTTTAENNNNASDHQDNGIKADNHHHHHDNSRKRKRQKKKKFEMLKGFCQQIVNKLMSQQEEMHNKLIEDMVKRDEEKVAREEAWKKQELDRFNQELELRAKEQAIAGDRQATIIKFLTKFASTSNKKQCLGQEDINPPNPNLISNNNQSNNVDQVSVITCPTTSMAEMSQATQNPNPKTPQNPNISANAAQQSNPSPPPTPSTAANNKVTQNPTSNDKEDLGKRWPRDEVLALINLRCSMYNNGDHHHDKEGSTATSIKAPLWERISQGMLQLGYKRSAKRCKEKWENINKYFRKTKDVNKKRSLDSRTCPYFHQLSTLYNQGTLIPPSEAPENRPPSPENHSDLPDEAGTIKVDSSTVQVSQGTDQTNMVQVAAFEFEF